VGGVTILKTGEDAANLGIIDLFWDSNGEIQRSITVESISSFPVDKRVGRYVDNQELFLEEMMGVKITSLPEGRAHLLLKRD